MIDKLLVLKNIGIFDNLYVDTSLWDKGFKKNNLIYAENGQGKTTISIIFESLAKNNEELLIGRKTLGESGSQQVEFLSGSDKIRFKDNVWKGKIPDMEIFNSGFVAENLYIGDTIKPEHKRNLHQFVLGEEGVKLIDEINKIDYEIKTVNDKIRSLGKIINSYTDEKMAVEDFIKLPPNDDIDKQIDKNQAILKNLLLSDQIIKRKGFKNIDIRLPQIEEIRELISKSYDEISLEAEQLVNEHIKCLGNKNSKDWIYTGLRSMQGDNCPFCGSNTYDNKLIQAYKQYFNQQYEKYKKELYFEIGRIEQEIEAINMYRLKADLMDNIEEAKYWCRKVDICDVERLSGEIITIIQEIIERLKSLLEEKKNDILSPVHLPDEIVKIIQVAYSEVAAYQLNVVENNKKIKRYKSEIRDTSKDEILDRLAMLNLNKKRYSPEVMKTCKEYKCNIEKKQKLDRNKAITREKLDAYTEKFKYLFGEEINQILDKFGAGFKICELDTDYRGGPKLEFKLSINGQPILLYDTKNRDTIPQFKNTLSEGDKSTLAFAFFLARLKNSDNLANKIVVIDDPISSLDYHRINMTASMLSRLVVKVKQIFVFTHDLKFAKKYFDQTQGIHGINMLEIKDKRFSRFDINKYQLSDYFINYFILDDYINGESFENEISVARAIRPLLEGHYRMHYPKHFTCKMWLGDFIKMVREASDEQPYYELRDSLADIEAVNEYAKQFHHDTNPMADSVNINSIELKSFVDATLKLCS